MIRFKTVLYFMFYFSFDLSLYFVNIFLKETVNFFDFYPRNKQSYYYYMILVTCQFSESERRGISDCECIYLRPCFEKGGKDQ